MLVTILFYTSSDKLINGFLDQQQGLTPAQRQETYDLLTGNVKSVFIAFVFFTIIMVSYYIP